MHLRPLPRPLSLLLRTLCRVAPLFLVLLATASTALAAPGRNQILLKVRDASLEQTLHDLLPAGSRITQALPQAERVPGLERILRITLDSGQDAASLALRLQASPLVEWAELPPLRHTDLVPDDTHYGNLWAPAAVQAETAWNTPGP